MRRSESPRATPAAPASDSLEDLKDRIELFLLGLRRPVFTESGREVIDLAACNYSLSTEYSKLLWHIWNERTNLVRQITGIHKESSGRMELRFQKFGKGPPGVIVLAESRAGAEQLERRGERTRYAQRLRRFLAQLFPEWKIEQLSSEPDLKNSFSGVYTRGVLVRGQQAWALIAAGEHEDPQSAEGILTYGVIWLDWLRKNAGRRVVEGLKIFVPLNRASSTVQRLQWLDSALAKWEVYEVGEDIRRCDLADIGNLKTSLCPAGGSSAPDAVAQSWIERITMLDRSIATRLSSDGFRLLTIEGLPFAKESPRGVVFGVGRAETPLDETIFSELKRLVATIVRFRQAQPAAAQARQHPYYRLQAEKWMEAVLLRDVGVLGYDLAADIVYEQVPTISGADRAVMDVLAVNSRGRLVVIELKASEDIHLPLQALDYWMRVHWHQRRGELERHGYFPQRRLSAEPPLLLLVSPALQFHPACETVLRYFSPAVEVVRIGVNEQWRAGLHVMFRVGR